MDPTKAAGTHLLHPEFGVRGPWRLIARSLGRRALVWGHHVANVSSRFLPDTVAKSGF
jgi:hypothetical protein